MILPGMGVVSEVITCFARKRIFGYHFVAFSSMAIAIVGFLVWGHHMFVSSQSIYAGMVFSLLSSLSPFHQPSRSSTGLQRCTRDRFLSRRRCCTYWDHRTVHGRRIDGTVLGGTGGGCAVTDTYFVVAHFHISWGGMVTAFMGGLHYWCQKSPGACIPRNWVSLQRDHVVGFNLTFFPQFLVGYSDAPAVSRLPPEFQIYQVLSTAGATILGVAYLLPVIYLVWSLFHGKRAPANPWRATGLEWQTPSPPPKITFRPRRR